jgi:dienelactone hydrolase
MSVPFKLFFAALLAWSCGVVGASTVDLRGTWEGVYDDPVAIELIKLTINKDGSSWKASVESIFTPTGKSGKDSARELTITGNQLSFAVEWRQFGYQFRGRVDGNTIEGTYDLSRRGEIQSTGAWRVRRTTGGAVPGKAGNARDNTRNDVRDEARDSEMSDTNSTAAAEAAAPPARNELPRPTGPRAVGRTAVYWTDSSRAEVCTDDPRDHRRLKVTLWYPAQIKGGPAPAAYFPGFDRLRDVEATLVPDFSPSLRTHAFEQPPVFESGAPFPVLVFSHGLGANTDSYTAIFTDLASHGYVIAAIDHTFDNRGTLFPEGKLVTIDERWSIALHAAKDDREKFTVERLEVMAEDAEFVRRKLDEVNQHGSGMFSGKLDLSKLGIFGHSVGGAAAAVACRKFKAFKASANLDGMPTGAPFLSDSKGAGIQQPFLFLTKRFPLRGGLLARSGLNRSEFEELDAQRRRRVYHLDSGMTAGFALSIDNAQHISFSDFPLLMSDPTPSYRNRYSVLHLVRTCVRSFFDKYLLGQRVPLFDGSVAQYPGVTVDRYAQQPNR